MSYGRQNHGRDCYLAEVFGVSLSAEKWIIFMDYSISFKNMNNKSRKTKNSLK